MLAIVEYSGGMGGFGVGLHGEGGKIDLAVNAQSIFSLPSACPHRQINIQLSQTLFLPATVLVRFSQVDMSTWTVDLVPQEALPCLYPAPWPWMEKNPPLIHFRLTAVFSCVMRQSRVSFWVVERLVRSPLPPPLLFRPPVEGGADLISTRIF